MALQTAQLGQMGSFSTPSAVGVQRRDPKLWQQALAQALSTGVGDVVHAGVGNAMSRDYAPELGGKAATGWDRLVHGPSKTEADYRQAITERGLEGRTGAEIGARTALSRDEIAARAAEGTANRGLTVSEGTANREQAAALAKNQLVMDAYKLGFGGQMEAEKLAAEKALRDAQISHYAGLGAKAQSEADFMRDLREKPIREKAAKEKADAEAAAARAARGPSLVQRAFTVAKSTPEQQAIDVAAARKQYGATDVPTTPPAGSPAGAAGTAVVNPDVSSELGTSVSEALATRERQLAAEQAQQQAATAALTPEEIVDRAYAQKVLGTSNALTHAKEYSRYPSSPYARKVNPLQAELDALLASRNPQP